MIKKSVQYDSKLYVLQENKSACVFYSLSHAFFFIGDKIAAKFLKDKIISSLKANNRLKMSQDAALNRIREKGKPI